MGDLTTAKQLGIPEMTLVEAIGILRKKQALIALTDEDKRYKVALGLVLDVVLDDIEAKQSANQGDDQ